MKLFNKIKYKLETRHLLIKSKRGFTLIELLVVVAIIALLSSVVLASVGEFRTRAQWKAFDAEIIQIRNAIQLYVTETGNFPTETNKDINSMLSELKDNDFYQKTELETPDGYGVRVFEGYSSGKAPWHSCGTPHDEGTQLVFAVWEGEIFTRSEIFNSPVYGLAGQNDIGGACFSIK